MEWISEVGLGGGENNEGYPTSAAATSARSEDADPYISNENTLRPVLGYIPILPSAFKFNNPSIF